MNVGFDQNDNFSVPPGQPEPEPVYVQQAPPKKRTGWKVFWAIVIILSVLANIIFFMALIGMVAVFATTQDGIFTEDIIVAGPAATKIAVINLQDLIDDETAEDIYKQIKRASEDENVKGLIIRVNSPGGTVAASDRINQEILKYKDETEKPVVAFMQDIATSGGYYASVAADKIVAEPTIITGSIGVIFGHFVIRELLEEKLGIEPVIIKSGEKKDWPSPFSETTDAQRRYIERKLITPAYERFVRIVADQRAELSADDVRQLADGSIYNADEALENKMIDQIGYLDDAIETAKELAGVEKARVVEYKEPFSFASFLRSGQSSRLKIDKTTLYEFTKPQLLYLWTID